MDFFTIFMIGIGVSMDAVAVAICDGMSLRSVKFCDVAVIAGSFGLAQGLMPIIGYFIGQTFSGVVVNYSNIVAFVLLSYIGVKMIIEVMPIKREKDNKDDTEGKCFLTGRLIAAQAIATSIDALAVGVSFAVIRIQVAPASLLIGITTFLSCAVGVILGRFTGKLLRNKAVVVGGVVLIAIGLKILLEM